MIELEHGEIYGKLTVLTKIKTARGTKGRVKACLKCSGDTITNTVVS